MMFLRKILFPLAMLYWIVTRVRNKLFDTGMIKSVTWPVPVIAVGNLSAGGTGKTPQVEYLLRLLSGRFQTAVLSRGYKRTTKGFVLAGEDADASTIGDEPFQYYTNFPATSIAVDANRNHGIEMLLNENNPPEVIVLDDAFQHRKVRAGLYILLTMYGDLYCDDYILPFGNLREPATGAKRAQIVVVTKCPPSLSAAARQDIRTKLKLDASQSLFFSYIDYNKYAFSENQQIDIFPDGKKLIVAGIARPEVFFKHVFRPGDETLTYPDHHAFTTGDIETILTKAAGGIIVTTQKDYVRLKGKIPGRQLYYLPITCEFIADGEVFDKAILQYVSNTPKG